MKREKEIKELILEPHIPIVDPHHHLWMLRNVLSDVTFGPNDENWRRAAIGIRRKSRYLFDELIDDLTSGHNVRATVYMEAGSMYRTDGPESMKSVGEVEFANGIAAMGASGSFGNVRFCAGIVGAADLSLGDGVEPVLQAHIRAGGGRYRGVRNPAHHDPDPDLFPSYARPHLLLDASFRAGFKWLHRFGLSFDVWIWEPQLPDLIDLARGFPETQIILNHVGGPLGGASYSGRREERFPIWRANMRTLSKCLNVAVKLGGLGSTPIQGFKSFLSKPPATSEELAAEWKPYVEACIEEFGVNRCMFESDFPPGSFSGTYPIVWNAFKRLTVGASPEEKAALFSGTAIGIYKLPALSNL